MSAAPLRVAMAPMPSAQGNPFVRQMAQALAADGCAIEGASVASALRADVLHLHWPDHFVNRTAGRLASVRGAVKVLLMALLVRARRRAVVWTVHNLRPHDARHPGVERAFWPVFTRLVSGCVYLTSAGMAAAEATFPALRRTARTVVPHGSYTEVYPVYPGTPADARRSLGMPPDAAPLVFFGQIRAYKNVPGLLSAFSRLDDPGARLIVAGSGPDERLIGEIGRDADSDGRVVITGRVEDDDVGRVMSAAVGAVLPYHDVFNSGSLFLALSFARPVLVPRTDVFAEVQAQVGEAWVRFFDPPLSAADLRRFRDDAVALTGEETRPDLTAFDWHQLGPRIVVFYRGLVPTPRRAR